MLFEVEVDVVVVLVLEDVVVVVFLVEVEVVVFLVDVDVTLVEVCGSLLLSTATWPLARVVDLFSVFFNQHMPSW